MDFCCRSNTRKSNIGRQRKIRFLQQLVPELAPNDTLCANYKRGYCGLHTHTQLPHSAWFLTSLPHSNRAKLTRRSHQNAVVSHASSLCSVLSSSTFSLSLTVGVSTLGCWICLYLYPSIASIRASSHWLQLQLDQKENEYLGQSHNLSLVSLLLQGILPDFHDGFWSLSFLFLLLCWLIHTKFHNIYY